jgi:hypothetical protein
MATPAKGTNENPTTIIDTKQSQLSNGINPATSKGFIPGGPKGVLPQPGNGVTTKK